MRFLEALGRFVGRVLLGLARIVGQVLLALLRGAGNALSRLLARTLPWIAGAGVAYWLYLYQPNVLAALLQLGVVVFALWLMVRRVSHAPRRGERRRR